MEVSQDEMYAIDGGTRVSSILGTIGGVATIVGGVVCLCTPEPTTLTKIIGVSAIIAGVAWIGSSWT